MANLALEAYDGRVELSAIREMLDIPSGNLIAGGGIWPEPYKLDADSERKSFFGAEMRVAHCFFITTTTCPAGGLSQRRMVRSRPLFSARHGILVGILY